MIIKCFLPRQISQKKKSSMKSSRREVEKRASSTSLPSKAGPPFTSRRQKRQIYGESAAVTSSGSRLLKRQTGSGRGTVGVLNDNELRLSRFHGKQTSTTTSLRQTDESLAHIPETTRRSSASLFSLNPFLHLLQGPPRSENQPLHPFPFLLLLCPCSFPLAFTPTFQEKLMSSRQYALSPPSLRFQPLQLKFERLQKASLLVSPPSLTTSSLPLPSSLHHRCPSQAIPRPRSPSTPSSLKITISRS